MNQLNQSNLQPLQDCDIQFIFKLNASLVVQHYKIELLQFNFQNITITNPIFFILLPFI
jgi:hypothetical protein